MRLRPCVRGARYIVHQGMSDGHNSRPARCSSITLADGRARARPSSNRPPRPTINRRQGRLQVHRPSSPLVHPSHGACKARLGPCFRSATSSRKFACGAIVLDPCLKPILEQFVGAASHVGRSNSFHQAHTHVEITSLWTRLGCFVCVASRLQIVLRVIDAQRHAATHLTPGHLSMTPLRTRQTCPSRDVYGSAPPTRILYCREHMGAVSKNILFDMRIKEGIDR